MNEGERRKIGERGQITIPKQLREALDLRGGDEVLVREEGEKIVIERPISREDLAEGYQKRTRQQQEIVDEMRGTAQEANDHLGDVPGWEK
ncbi:AbrB/MazE/SpoVT family DNA-binding domain-containing protein [Natronobacterium texcoconense]|uniref:Looped-hinge helix DNA binding domain-containing protein, AbrB family n=1 Tax=Natronobacterium texcoconense TaxID=1095778 RepID=A0A1H1J0E8_NATTX|nr:AbrB/MazE/SpoVT family DNA-binding domain-containing protein [Natronobacterium texcoconense]SDR43383.1 looped-hinge helix DNA binding domain-containing protein, AbrB family [Natronobacterium texcoconense]